ncbi:hypothetical protein ACOME3_006865 [Neoechinorhynchus agilis]
MQCHRPNSNMDSHGDSADGVWGRPTGFSRERNVGWGSGQRSNQNNDQGNHRQDDGMSRRWEDEGQYRLKNNDFGGRNDDQRRIRPVEHSNQNRPRPNEGRGGYGGGPYQSRPFHNRRDDQYEVDDRGRKYDQSRSNSSHWNSNADQDDRSNGTRGYGNHHAHHNNDQPVSRRENQEGRSSGWGRDDDDRLDRRDNSGWKTGNLRQNESNRSKNDYYNGGDDKSNWNDRKGWSNQNNDKPQVESNETSWGPSQDLESRPPPVTYIPEEIERTEPALFSLGIRQGINFSKYSSVQVNVTGGDVEPYDQFVDSGLHDLLLSNIRKSKFAVPTPVQRYALPIIMEHRRDLMACAQTGSGKTAAFLLPILHDLLTNEIEADTSPLPVRPFALVLMPTRELVRQTYQTCNRLGFKSKIKTTMLYGGVATSHQYGQLRMGCHIVFATTGRLLDFVKRGFVEFSNCRYFVLDEADRMLDMGFEIDIADIAKIGKLASDRSTMMFSATFPTDVQKLAQSYLKKDYIFISTGIIGGACVDVSQEFVEVDRTTKRSKVKEILTELGNTKTLIFVGQKKFADFLASDLSQSGYVTTTIHGDRLQKEREEALNAFVNGKARCMVATNVAARGLDVPGVDNVINYDMPNELTEYVHRIGRTGRCGNPGRSITFYDKSDPKCAEMTSGLIGILKDAKQKVPSFFTEGGDGDGYGDGWVADNQNEEFQSHGAVDVRSSSSYNYSNSDNRLNLADYVPDEVSNVVNADYEQYDDGDDDQQQDIAEQAEENPDRGFEVVSGEQIEERKDDDDQY